MKLLNSTPDYFISKQSYKKPLPYRRKVKCMSCLLSFMTYSRKPFYNFRAQCPHCNNLVVRNTKIKTFSIKSNFMDFVGAKVK